MGILNIAPVSRSGMRYIMNFYGMSESGKTLSALKIMAGLEPDPSKRGLADSEGGERGRAFVDHIPGGYLYGALKAPFTPERYIEAISEFEEAGCNVLVIDSISHSWTATGGILDMVDAAPEKNDMAKWKKPKRRLGKMTQRIMHSDMHILLCSRAKQPLVKDANGNYVPGPVLPIQEKTLRYDMTIIAHMMGDGRFSIAKEDGGKCPGVLRPIFASQELMDEDMGRKLAAWIKAEQTKTPAERLLENSAQAAAEGGREAFLAFWKPLTVPQRTMLQPGLANYQSIAAAADKEAEQQAEGERENVEPEAPPEEPFGKPTLVVSTAAPAKRDTVTEIPIAVDPKTGRTNWSAWAFQCVAAVKALPSKAMVVDWTNLHKARLETAPPSFADQVRQAVDEALDDPMFPADAQQGAA